MILANLAYNAEFCRKVLPYIKVEYFEEKSDKILYGLIEKHIIKYNTQPSKESLFIDLSNAPIDERDFDLCREIVAEMALDSKTDNRWLMDETEKFCQNRAIYLALNQCMLIYAEKDKKLQRGAIPQILSDALAISFDSHIGMDFLEDSDQFYSFLHDPVVRIPFRNEKLNEITQGGVHNKTLTIFMAGTNVGKSALMCNFAADNLMEGKNVLYITLEMSEERISERIWANVLDLNIDTLKLLPKSSFDSKVKMIKGLTPGKLVIKEYPTSQAGVNNFRALLNELKLKKNFVPDIIYIDYINICASSRIKQKADSYGYILSISEEIRGLGVEFDVPIISATQFNREGYNSSNPDIDNVAESFGQTFTADYIFLVVSTEELERAGQLMIIQGKNRYGNKNKPKSFLIGIDRDKMKVFDIYDKKANNSLTGNRISDRMERGNSYEDFE